VGTRAVEQQLGVAAINARTHAVELGEMVAALVNGKAVPV
jgi:hypothetical protein